VHGLVKAILWDMDGVVADTGEAHYLAWKQLFAERGELLTQEKFAETFGMANTPILQAWLGPQADIGLIRELAERKEKLFREQVRKHVRLLPGVQSWLVRGRELGYRQAIASSGDMANIVAVLGALDISNAFDALLSGAFLPRSKPDPTIFLRAAAALGAAPSECVVIEDGIVGVEAAHRAGMRCIAVTNTHPMERLSDADLVIDSLAELDEDALVRVGNLVKQ
jgi:beta-phosphoglucomutase-like phosphatase (HAD superfamily)